jgi:hypothetical protein
VIIIQHVNDGIVFTHWGWLVPNQVSVEMRSPLAALSTRRSAIALPARNARERVQTVKDMERKPVKSVCVIEEENASRVALQMLLVVIRMP